MNDQHANMPSISAQIIHYVFTNTTINRTNKHLWFRLYKPPFEYPPD